MVSNFDSDVEPSSGIFQYMIDMFQGIIQHGKVVLGLHISYYVNHWYVQRFGLYQRSGYGNDVAT